MKPIHVRLKSVLTWLDHITIKAGETGLGLEMLGLDVPDQVALEGGGLGAELTGPDHLSRASVRFRQHLVYVTCNTACERFSCFFRE